MSEIFQRLWVVRVHALVLALLEDDKNSLQVVDSLKQSGHSVVRSVNFTHAIEILKSQNVDLIISDVHLENGGSVFDFLRWVKKNPSTNHIPFVMFSFEPTKMAKYVEDGVKISARMLGTALFLTMDDFDSVQFCKEIDFLLSADGTQSNQLNPFGGDR